MHSEDCGLLSPVLLPALSSALCTLHDSVLRVAIVAAATTPLHPTSAVVQPVARVRFRRPSFRMSSSQEAQDVADRLNNGGGETKKRRRWGDNPAEDHNKRSKVHHVQKRVWVSVSDERPGSHYVSYLKRSFGQMMDRVKETLPDLDATVQLQGRGASDEPPLPGIPIEPLHVQISGPDDQIPIVEAALLDLLKLAKEAPKEGRDDVDPNLQLAKIEPSSNYRPASVALMIGGNVGIANEADLHLTDTILVPNSVVGFIIGRGGDNITRMQMQTGAKVQVEKDLQPGQTQRVITLKASNQQALDDVKKMVQALVDDRVGTSSVPRDAKVEQAVHAGHVLVEMKVPDTDVGLVIGRAGSTIKSIQEQSGANIQVPQQGEDGMRTVLITHPSEAGANYAKQLIDDILRSRPAAAAAGPQVTVEIMIPDRDVGLCIGRGGCVIKQMQSLTNTRIQIPSQAQAGSQFRVASVSGPQEGVNKVQQMIERIGAEQSSASVMSGGPWNSDSGVNQYYAGQHPTEGQQEYSAEWAAYYAAQAAAGHSNAAGTAQAAPAPAPSHSYATAPAPAAVASSSQQPAADAYYEQFFRYAYYYGEDAARQYYGAWSPPVGTPNPYGTNPNGVQPPPSSTAPASAEAPAPAPVAQAPAPNPAPAAPPSTTGDSFRDSSRRKVSNLPAWMTKN